MGSGKSKFYEACGLALVFFFIHVSPVIAKEVRVAVASNFLLPLKEIAESFKKSNDNKVVVISGSTGKLFAQIKQGAPFDIFLAADSIRPEILEKEGIAVSGTRFTYAVGRLALWSPDTRFAIKKDLQVLNQKNFRYLAMANPKTAPYGKAAEQVLRKTGFWDKIQSRLVRGENISQTLQFVVTGNADMGFIALSQLKNKRMKISGRSLSIPNDWHDPIRQQAILLKRAKSNQTAHQFLDYLKSNSIQKLIESFGYFLEKE